MTAQTKTTAKGAQIRKRAHGVRAARLKRDTPFFLPTAELDRGRFTCSARDSDILLLAPIIEYFNQTSAAGSGVKILCLCPSDCAKTTMTSPGYLAAGRN